MKLKQSRDLPKYRLFLDKIPLTFYPKRKDKKKVKQ